MAKSTKIPQKDRELIQVAVKTLNRLFKRNRHEVAAALRCKDGSVYAGIHIEAKTGGYADVCGEIVAISCALADGQCQFDSIVAVTKGPKGGYRILPPCGRCRDVISDFSGETSVLLGTVQTPKRVRVKHLIPCKPV